MFKRRVTLDFMTQFKPDHARMARLLQAAGAEESAAEAHGMLCGMLCAGLDRWQPHLLAEAEEGDLLAREAADELEALWQLSGRELRERRMPIQLLLPEDERPVEERATALRDWSQGFLYGLGLGGKQKESLFRGEAGEALRDFSEIARMDLEEFGQAEEAEEALMQLAEYLWVATSLIWHEIHADESR
jgi:uncharacterized protein YgfB (UPF0149 family)